MVNYQERMEKNYGANQRRIIINQWYNQKKCGTNGVINLLHFKVSNNMIIGVYPFISVYHRSGQWNVGYSMVAPAEIVHGNGNWKKWCLKLEKLLLEHEWWAINLFKLIAFWSIYPYSWPILFLRSLIFGVVTGVPSKILCKITMFVTHFAAPKRTSSHEIAPLLGGCSSSYKEVHTHTCMHACMHACVRTWIALHCITYHNHTIPYRTIPYHTSHHSYGR